MKKFKRFSIFLLVGILLFSLFFPACGKENHSADNTNTTSNSSDSSSQIKTSYIFLSLDDDFEQGKLTIAKTRTSLIDFIAEESIIPDKYTDQYFLTYSIIAFIVWENIAGNTNLVKSYTINDNLLTITVESLELYDNTVFGGSYCLLLEVKNDEIKNVDCIQIIKNGILIS